LAPIKAVPGFCIMKGKIIENVKGGGDSKTRKKKIRSWGGDFSLMVGSTRRG